MHIESIGRWSLFRRKRCCRRWWNWGSGHNVHRLRKILHHVLIVVHDAGVTMVTILRHKVYWWRLEVVHGSVSRIGEVSDTDSFTRSPTFERWKHHCFRSSCFSFGFWNSNGKFSMRKRRGLALQSKTKHKQEIEYRLTFYILPQEGCGFLSANQKILLKIKLSMWNELSLFLVDLLFSKVLLRSFRTRTVLSAYTDFPLVNTYPTIPILSVCFPVWRLWRPEP